MIPKIIHQIWVGDQSLRPNKLMETWKDLNPTWEYMLWTEDNLPELINKKQFNAIEELAGKADILRYEILYKYGGFYIDADSKCVNPLDDNLLECDSFCCWENEYERCGLMANGYLAACKGNDLMDLMIKSISNMNERDLKNLPPISSWKVVGPVFLTNSVISNKYHKIKIYPSHYFIPVHYTGLDQSYKTPIYSEQYFMSTPPSGNKYGE